MQQLLSVWFALDARRRGVVALSAIAMFAAVFGLSRLATSPNLTLLYSGLESGTAGQVVKALEQQKVTFEIRGDSIFVEGAKRDQLRMNLASDGLPANSSQGYEILDNLSGFGTTAQMFDAAYWRAKEGELARTIAASPQFGAARVHISNTASQPFKRAAKPSASVTVSGVGGAISGTHAKALRFLVASAVAGMVPADVSVIDANNGVVVADENEIGTAPNGADRSTELKQNIERLLEARVGTGNAIVEVFMDIETDSETLVERRFDPDGRVAISSEKLERNTNSNNTRGSTVTVASNLPDGDGATGNNESTNQDNETTERINYEVSESTREVLRVPGAINRLSIAVLVDGVTANDPTTNLPVWSARDDQEIDALRELVTSAAGLDVSRGDTLTLKSLQFSTIETEGLIAEMSVFQKLNINVMRLIQFATLSVVTLVLGLFVLRPILANNPVPQQALPASANAPGLPGPQPIQTAVSNLPTPEVTTALTGEIDERSAIPPGLETVGNIQPSGRTASSQPAIPADPVERLRAMIADRQDETVDILRTWIDGSEERI